MELTQKLLSIFVLVNDWLKFAEAKNAILLTFSGAAITAISAYLAAVKETAPSLQLGLIFSLILLGICSLVCAISFLPKTNLENIAWQRLKPSRKRGITVRDTDNFYFFGDLRRYEPVELVDAINKFYLEGLAVDPRKKENVDIAIQLIINADIASIKFGLFTCALWFLVSAISSIPLSMLFSLLIFRHL
jgi:hypothetical protein